MRLKAFGLIDLLIGLLIATVILYISMQTFTNSVKLNTKNNETKSIQEYVDKQVSEIENMRNQSIMPTINDN